MELTEEDVLKILRLVDQSSFDQLQIETGDLKLSVSNNGGTIAGGFMKIETRAAEPRSANAPVAERSDSQSSVGRALESSPPTIAPPSELEAGLIPIPSPMLGTFYRSPEPGAPPFADVGSRLAPDDTVGLIEVMKVFTTVPAAVRGEVVAVCAENGKLVEYGQPLFLVRPDAG